jgi:N-acetylglucosaminyldiphosphoundecaprenol N-acetyl-beta-D-mannosaminyltransferase
MSSRASAAGRRILGIRVDDADMDQTLATAARALAERTPRQIVTINPEMLMLARHDDDLGRCVERACLVVPDGVGLILAGRLLGQPLRERVCGSDLVPLLSLLAAECDWSVFLLGAGPGVAEQAAGRLISLVPGLHLAGAYSGSPSLHDEEAVIARVRLESPDMLFVAYGVPSEEKWIARNLQRLGVPLVIGVGGALDFVAGAVPRAPRAMRSLGLEWLYRLNRQPWRWRRMLALPKFAALVLAEAITARLGLWHLSQK